MSDSDSFDLHQYDWSYSPITLRVLNGSNRGNLFGLSGIFLTAKLKSIPNPTDSTATNKTPPAKELIISIINIPREFLEIQNKLDIYFTSKELINNSKNGKGVIQWIQCKLIKLQHFMDDSKNDDETNLAIPYEINNFLGSRGGFEFQISHDQDINDIKNSCVLVAKPKYSLVDTLSLKSIELLEEVDSAAHGFPLNVTFESSPFSLSNVSMFNNFSSVGHLNYSNKLKEFYLSDLKYLDNMNGGVVNLITSNPESTATSTTNPITNKSKSIGLIWGNLIKNNGQGELLIVLSWNSIFKNIKTTLTQFLLNDNGIFPFGFRISKNLTCGGGELFKISEYLEMMNTANAVTTRTRSFTNHPTVGITITSKEGGLYWGSGVIFDNDLILTNRHVIMGDYQFKEPKRVVIWHQEEDGTKSKIVLKNPKLNKDIFVPFDNKLFDICFIKLNATSNHYINAVKLPNNFTIKESIKHLITEINMETNESIQLTSGDQINDSTESIGFGLFFNEDHSIPMKAHGHISTVISLDSLFDKIQFKLPSLVVTSSSCWSGSSGGALINNKYKELIGVMVSNGRLNTGETLNKFNLVIPLEIVLLGYYDVFIEKLEFNKSSVDQVRKLYDLQELYSDLFLESAKL